MLRRDRGGCRRAAQLVEAKAVNPTLAKSSTISHDDLVQYTIIYIYIYSS